MQSNRVNCTRTSIIIALHNHITQFIFHYFHNTYSYKINTYIKVVLSLSLEKE